MDRTTWIGIGVICAACIGALAFALHNNARCEAAGGVLVVGRAGNFCVDRSAIIQPAERVR
jgi:hypothetical protein